MSLEKYRDEATKRMLGILTDPDVLEGIGIFTAGLSVIIFFVLNIVVLSQLIPNPAIGKPLVFLFTVIEGLGVLYVWFMFKAWLNERKNNKSNNEN